MWCLCSHIATPIYKAQVPSVTASSLPRRRCHAVSANQQQRNQEGEEAQMSGSDVLWALQKASAIKKKKKKQEHGRGLSSASAATPMKVVDCTNVRPLCINTNWAAKLDELEKRLHQLPHTI